MQLAYLSDQLWAGVEHRTHKHIHDLRTSHLSYLMIAVKLSGPIGHDETGKVTSGKMVRLAIFWTAAVACRTFDLVLFPTAYPVPYWCCENDDLDSLCACTHTIPLLIGV